MTPLRRREDWPRRLSEAVEAARGAPFRWGQHDCCLFAAEVVDAICGSEFAARHRGRYRTSGGARRRLEKLGGLEVLLAPVGPEVPPPMAQRGDVVEIAPVPGAETEGAGLMLGVCLGETVAAAGPGGLVLLPLARARRAWRVGGQP